jgi:plastocyanin
MSRRLSFPVMIRRRAVAASIFVLLSVSGLAMALPLASAQSSPSVVVVSIPSGAGSGQGAAPGYSPDTIKVMIGVNNTVMWTNNDTSGKGTSHTVVPTTQPSGGSMPAGGSGNISPGAVYSLTFTVPGTYTYHCSYHSWMSGTVMVEAASTSTKTTPEFPATYLALTLFAVIAAVVVVATRLRPTLSAGSAGATTNGRFLKAAS